MFLDTPIELNCSVPCKKVTKNVVLKVQDAVGNKCKFQMHPNQHMLKLVVFVVFLSNNIWL